jgi:nitroimidazol reductase NimA-like FMN-containing flavoprotein (pyridoxamine 5'-phosphate oxidase superfamily)
MSDARPGVALLELDRAECEQLLAGCDVGRLAVVVDGRPHLLPVNYATPGGGVIVFRTAPGSVLTEASLQDVAFEVDQLDPASRSGWSVEVRGFGREIGDAVDAESARLRELPLVTWAPGERLEWFEIRPREVTGRRITSG